LVGTVLAAERNSVGRRNIVIDSAIVRGVNALPAATVLIELVQRAHFLWFVVFRGRRQIEELFCRLLPCWTGVG